MKKIIIVCCLVIIFFILFIFLSLRPKNYTLTYTVDGFEITEKYDKDNAYYYFVLKSADFDYDYDLEIKYRSKHELISSVKTLSTDDIYCIMPEIKDANTYPICLKDKELTSFHLIKNESLNKFYETKNNTEPIAEYNGITIYNYLDNTYLFWNYKGFYYLNEDTKKNLKILTKDIYNPLTAIVNNHLIIPTYANTHTFDSVHLIDLDNAKQSVWKLDKKIYLDSYIMGSVDKSIYLFDKNKKIQYELVPHKKKMRSLNKKDQGKIYQEKWEPISINNLSLNQPKFTYFEKYIYTKKDEKIYFKNHGSNIEMLVSNFVNPKIVATKNNTVFYLVNDKLYAFNPYQGEILIASYFEWTFNSDNMIYVY